MNDDQYADLKQFIVQVISQQTSDIYERLDLMDKRFEKIDERFEEIDGKLDEIMGAVGESFQDTNQQLADHGTRLKRLERKAA